MKPPLKNCDKLVMTGYISWLDPRSMWWYLSSSDEDALFNKPIEEEIRAGITSCKVHRGSWKKLNRDRVEKKKKSKSKSDASMFVTHTWYGIISLIK